MICAKASRRRARPVAEIARSIAAALAADWRVIQSSRFRVLVNGASLPAAARTSIRLVTRAKNPVVDYRRGNGRNGRAAAMLRHFWSLAARPIARKGIDE